MYPVDKSLPQLIGEACESNDRLNEFFNSEDVDLYALFSKEIPDLGMQHMKIHRHLQNKISELEESEELDEILSVAFEVLGASEDTIALIKNIANPEVYDNATLKLNESMENEACSHPYKHLREQIPLIPFNLMNLSFNPLMMQQHPLFMQQSSAPR